MLADGTLLDVLGEAAEAVRLAMATVDDWGPSGRREGQYSLDLVADEAAVTVLTSAGLGVLSEESGLHHPDRQVWVALDPVDGSSNASRHLPWFATSLCAVGPDGPQAALVVNLATGDRWEAVKGGGATFNGSPTGPTAAESLSEAIVGVTSCPPVPGPWRQVRAMGAAALDICSVASGSLDAYVDFSRDAHSPWDYLGGLLVCQEAGAVVAEPWGRQLVTRDEGVRRSVVAAATAPLLDEALALRLSAG
ncbi:MAG: inositol monophosphatase family protein [Actinomycetota bacterium]|jgi:myo-inositol-1(or 4)-monophosphatase